MAQAVTILFVDDDPLIRDVLPEVMTGRQFRSLVAEDGHEALRILAEAHIDILVTDIVMPDLDGIELAIQAKLIRPNLTVVLMTGYLSVAPRADTVAPLLFKPVRPEEIEAVIREAWFKTSR